MSRTRRFLGGIGFGFANQVLITVGGLWLTPFLLRRIGQDEYGLWLVATQLLGYLMLLDLGVVALLPRETAYATGRAGGVGSASDLPQLIGETLRVVLWQLPLVAVACLLVWLAMPASWAGLRQPLALVLFLFVILFPWRVLQAVLQGLQDLAFLGKLQMLTWFISIAASIGLILAGWGLFSLAIGWGMAQIVSAALWLYRIRTRFRTVLPSRLPEVPWSRIKSQLISGGWLSVGQIAQVLVQGTDILIVGKVFGPAAVVPFACTGKLISVLANQPQMLMQAASPALSELRAEKIRDRLFQVSSALGSTMLLVSGAVFCVVLAVNEGFVKWWVGPSQYGGTLLTVLLLISMILRHWNLTAGYTIFCFGYERHLALTSLVDGIVTVASSLFFASQLGVIGVPIGSIFGVCIVSLRRNLKSWAAELGVTRSTLLRPLRPWLWRFLLVAGCAYIAALLWTPSGFWQVGAMTSAAAMAYALIVLPILTHQPLRDYLMPRVAVAWPAGSRFLEKYGQRAKGS